MPEIKNTFTQGKMNKDLDERIVPNGQYRDALNIQVSTSDGADVGAVQNILGNTQVGSDRTGWECIGSIADEKNDVLYSFITDDTDSAIVEYAKDGTEIPVLVDIGNGILNFYQKIISFIKTNKSQESLINSKRCVPSGQICFHN